ncbi:MAG: hypothetical protein IJA67_15300 [Oscillospiraceae bacterium]|nr:hypothetical protein [Oscillospiraceae bacterium]
MTEAGQNYADIINLSRPVSPKHPPMSMPNRAAQFSPFAALTGYDSAVKETARLTDEKIALDEYAKSMLSDKLQMIAEHIDDLPEVTFIYFVPDKKKSGGAYVSVTGTVKEIDEFERIVVLGDGTKIPILEIYEIESGLFAELGYE